MGRSTVLTQGLREPRSASNFRAWARGWVSALERRSASSSPAVERRAEQCRRLPGVALHCSDPGTKRTELCPQFLLRLEQYMSRESSCAVGATLLPEVGSERLPMDGRARLAERSKHSSAPCLQTERHKGS